ncbi:MAG TPA: helix-turn-helix domain-containing protein [Solirubrobacteraceae bacterium]|nr:helix-turn-helix domain-containing protein [Solirubrobacteraceae bacterium]
MSELGQSEKVLLLLGRAFREIREQRGLSAGELATATGVNRLRIVSLEEGRLDPDYELLLGLAEGLGVRASRRRGVGKVRREPRIPATPPSAPPRRRG